MNYIDKLADRIEQSLSMDLRPKTDAKSLYRLYALLALVKGQDVTLENVHDSWSLWKSQTNPQHPSIVPFADLDSETQALDLPYVSVIRQTAKGLCFE